jgi:hypothetical protein
MGLALYMDVHVPYAVTSVLLLRGVDVLTAQLDETATLPDPELLDRATSLGRVLVTQDDDFLVEAAKRQKLGAEFAGVIYGHQLGLPLGKFIEDLELLAKVFEPLDLINRVEFLPLR